MKNSKIPTGFEQLDNILNGGFDKTDLIILGARPAMGKTVLALNITLNIAQNINKAVAIFSLEMSKEKVIQRLILQNKAEKNLNKILTLPIYIDDTADNTIDKIITKCNKLKLSENNLGLIVIDFLELLTQTPQIKNITNKLKHLALELNTPILCLSQLPRTIDESNTDNHFEVNENNKCGLVDSNGIEVIPPMYKHVHVNYDGTLAIYQDKQHGIFDYLGKEIIPIGKYKFMGDEFSEGLLWVSEDKNDTGMFINKLGKVVLKLDKNIKAHRFKFSCGLAPVWHKKYGDCYLDKTGNIVEVQI